MENNGRKMFIALLALRLLKPTVTEARVTCHPPEQHNSGGPLYMTVSNSEECDEGRWKVNDQVVAHDGDSNKSLVQSHGRSNITFSTCLENITYVCDRDIIPCKNVCPAKSDAASASNLDYI